MPGTRLAEVLAGHASDEDVMEVTCRFDPGDVIAFWKYCDANVPAYKREYVRVRFIRPLMWSGAALLGILVARVVVFRNDDFSEIPGLLVPFVFGVLIYVAMYPKIRQREMQKSLTKAMATQPRYISEPIVYRVSREGFYVRHALAEGTTSWEAFELVVTPERTFLTYEPEPTNAYIIPRAAFTDEAAYRAFIDRVKLYQAQATGKPLSRG